MATCYRIKAKCSIFVLVFVFHEYGNKRNLPFFKPLFLLSSEQRKGTAMLQSTNTVFRPGKNCWRAERARHGALLIDCANYYRALHEAIVQARHCIFITGWDIDSRIHLLRGEEAQRSAWPVNLYGLLVAKAQQNPDLQIYLNRWSYALIMAASREPMSAYKWKRAGLPNIHFCRDNTVPMGACHHQKIIVVDDELAFCGGMDIALDRWDKREHFPVDHKRKDPGGVYNPDEHHHYGPYHDIQCVVSGSAARALALHSRDRWRTATGEDPVTMRPAVLSDLPEVWPGSREPHFENIPVSIALTHPESHDRVEAFHIEEMYMSLIARAEKFIYMENQYFTRRPVAEALNKRLREVPDLKILAVSSYDPQGIIEKESMWGGRIAFRKLVTANGMDGRCLMAYPMSRVGSRSNTIRIHSKLMIVDNRYLHIGSANMNNRSMRLDTECDLTFEAVTDDHARAIESLRNDLIREHTGREKVEIQDLIDHSPCVHALVEEVPHSRQHLVPIDDSVFEDKYFSSTVACFGDPECEIMKGSSTGEISIRGTVGILGVLFVLAALTAGWGWLAESGVIGPDRIATFIEMLGGRYVALPAAFILFTLFSLAFAPVTILIPAMAIMFGPAAGFGVAMAGSLACAAIAFYMGNRLSRMTRMEKKIGKAGRRIRDFLDDTGIVSLSILRMVPIAPFMVVNLALPALGVRFPSYIAATFLGLFPGAAVLCFAGGSLLSVVRDPAIENVLALAGGAAAWIMLVLASHHAYRHWKLGTKTA